MNIHNSKGIEIHTVLSQNNFYKTEIYRTRGEAVCRFVNKYIVELKVTLNFKLSTPYNYFRLYKVPHFASTTSTFIFNIP